MSTAFAVGTGRTLTVNGTLNTGTNAVTGAGAFTLSSGATLGIGSPDGINTGTALGNLRVSGTRTFNAGANYIFNGTSEQVTGNGFPAAVNGLTVAAGAKVILPTGITATTLTNNGTITQTQTIAGNSTANFINTGSYHGVDITNTVPSSMGAVTVTVKGNQGCTTNLGTEPVNRCFNITPATPQPAVIKFWYTSAEAANNPDASTNAYHWGGVNGWELLTGVTTSSGLGTDRWVQANVTAYSPFLLDDPLVGPETFASPLAVTTRELTATAPAAYDVTALLALTFGGLVVALLLARRATRSTSN